MNEELRRQIYNSLNERSTAELVEIWRKNDREEWSDEAFEAIEQILGKRVRELLPQGETDESPEADDAGPQTEAAGETAAAGEAEQDEEFEWLPDEEFVEAGEAEEADEEESLEEELEEDASEPVFYDPQEVMQLAGWLRNAAWIAMPFTLLASIYQSIQILQSMFSTTGWALIAAGMTIVAGLLNAALVYFCLYGLATTLRILMEMEFNSRGAKA